MTMEWETDPFGTEPIDEIQLINAPLARVIVQARFPKLVSLSTGDETAKMIIGRLGSSYPIFQEGALSTSVTVSQEGIQGIQGSEKIWQLRSADEAWQISFCNTYIAFDTGTYLGRTDFLERFAEVLGIFIEIARPPYFERLGFRYINRLTEDESISKLKTLVRPEILGGLGVSTNGAELKQSICDSVFQIGPETFLQARWGMLPPHVVADPSIESSPNQSWVLDIDVSTTDRESIDPVHIIGRAHKLALQGYRFFRWIVLDGYLDAYGAKK